MNTSGRRHRQALNGYSHMPKQRRPHYKMRSREASEAHERQLRETAKRIQQGKKK